MPYGLLGSMRTKPGARAEVVAILLEGVGELSAVGCRSYVVGLSTTDEDAIWISEVWENKQAHEDSLQLPSVRDAISRAMPLLTGEFSSEEVSVVGGIGI
ncbi:antibiotic biosynthesis monooxygenase [Kineococcus xinjiangensis]